MTADYEQAALKATETLIQYNITAAPVEPIRIIKSLPDTLVLPFAEVALKTNEDRDQIIRTFGESQDAVTSVHLTSHGLCYVVAFNQRLPAYIIQRAMARELGHIVLRHDGSRPDDVRYEEAITFARHLICPRPLLRAISDAGISLTVEMLGNVTGCYERCLAGLRKTPGVSVPPELNRKVREQFADYVTDFAKFHPIIARGDDTPIADFGSYMDNYEE